MKLNKIGLYCLFSFAAIRAVADPLSVSITTYQQDTKQGCSVTFSATATGGCPPYTYSWVADGLSQTGQSVTAQINASKVGSATFTVTAKDNKNATASDSKNLTSHKEVETTTTNNGSDFFGPGKFVSDSATCPADSPGNCSIAYMTTSSVSVQLGVTVTGSVDIKLVTTSVAGSASRTSTTQTGTTYTYLVAPGQTKAVQVRACLKKREGTWTKYDCNGAADNGNWTDTTQRDPAWDYTVATPS